MEKIVLRDKNNRLYFQCWTEGNTIFLTDDFTNVTCFKTVDDAINMAKHIADENCHFLNDADDSELFNVIFQAGILIPTFVPFKENS